MNHLPLIIYNPTANRGNAGKILPAVKDMLREAGFDYRLILTEGTNHAQQLSKQACEEGCSLIVAAGGDGTVNEVINGMMRADLNGRSLPALAVLPVGRGNDFAYGSEIPLDPREAVQVLVTGKQRSIDVGYVSGGDYPEGRYFGNGIGLGFDAVVSFEAKKIQWVQGVASYLLALLKTVFLYSKAPIYEVVMDGEAVQEPFLMISVMNGRRMAGMFLMAPESANDDGALDLCLAAQVPQTKIIPLAVKFISGKQQGHPAIRMRRVHRMTVRAIKGVIPAHADGETICTAGERLTIEVLPDALQVLSRVNSRTK